MFSVATAITRLTGSGKNAFQAGFTAGNHLQRINEVLERFYEFGSWRGLHDTIDITTTSGIISLSTAYQRLDGLSIPSLNALVPIKSQKWAFSPGGPGAQDWTLYPELIALDQGDTAGVRKYLVSGNATANDALTFSGLARKRFTWITNTADIVEPDSFQALRLGVQALGWEDEGDTERYQAVFQQALQVLNGNLQEFEPETKQVVIQPSIGLGSMAFVH